MAILTPSELLDWLQEYQFLSAAQADELRPALGTFADSHALAKTLIARDWLTPYQVNQMLTGKHHQLVLGSYRLQERIGEGAMGQVFKAWNARLERVVALKTLNKQMVNSAKAMDRFRREVEAAARLKHPNIALVRDADEVEGRPFLVMEFIEGTNLSKLVKQKGALPIAEAVAYARQAALGLQHAHERGVVHRDIKPANLLIATLKNPGDAPVVKILDFGLACYESERENSNRLTQVGSLLGTVDYVAPEQAQDATKADIRADIYSLGCTLFYLLAGRPPFLGETVVERLAPRLTNEPPYIRTLRPEVTPGLEQVLLKMMARRPEDRYQTPVEAAQALEPFAAPFPRPQPLSGDARGVMLAQPVTTPAAGAIPLAMPVLAPGLPLAQPDWPIAEEIPPAAPPETDPVFFSMSSTGLDLSGSASPPRPKTKKPVPIKAIVGCGASLVALLICLSGCVLGYRFWGRSANDGSLKITKAMWSTGKDGATPGQPHHVLVWIERVKFSGPVKVTLKDVPDGVHPIPHIIPANSDNGQFRYTVSYGVGPLTKNVKVVAECESKGITAEYPLKLIVNADKN